MANASVAFDVPDEVAANHSLKPLESALISVGVHVVLAVLVFWLKSRVYFPAQSDVGSSGAFAFCCLRKTTPKQNKKAHRLESFTAHSLESGLTPHSQIDLLSEFQQQRARSVFISYTRSETNFVRNNTDPELELPPMYPAERAIHAYSFLAMFRVFINTVEVRGVLLGSLGVALLNSALASLLWLNWMEHWQHNWVWIKAITTVRDKVSTSIHWFITFLLLGLINFVVTRWRDWLVNCHTVQARIHDLAIMVGSALADPSDVCTRKNLYKLYRYLNVIHALTYQSVNPLLPNQLDGFVPLGLLTANEVPVLEPIGNRKRDLLLTWVGGTIEMMIRQGQVRELAISNTAVAELRGITARHQDLFVRNMPNLWFATGLLLKDTLVLVEILALPLHVMDEFGFEGDERPNLVQISFMNIVGCFLITVTYWLAWSMVDILGNPFTTTSTDAYSTDALLGSTDRCIFVSLRGLFDYPFLPSFVEAV